MRRKSPPSTTIVERFWPKVRKAGPDDCWEWLGNKTKPYGHGIFFVGGEKNQEAAHRVAWKLAGNELPRGWGLVLDHICHNPSCVNVRHLRLVTNRDNSVTFASNHGPCGRNALKDHCHKGHHFSPENTYHAPIRKGVTRICLTCYREKFPGTAKQPNTYEDAYSITLARRAAEGRRVAPTWEVR